MSDMIDTLQRGQATPSAEKRLGVRMSRLETRTLLPALALVLMLGLIFNRAPRHTTACACCWASDCR